MKYKGSKVASPAKILDLIDCIIELKAVKALHLYGNPLETRISGNLWKLTTLTHLNLGSCQLTSLHDTIGNLIKGNLDRQKLSN